MRVAIFVDGANMFYAQKELGWFIEYKKVLKYFSEGKTLSCAYYICAQPPFADPLRFNKYESFKKALTQMGYTVKNDKTLRRYYDEKEKREREEGDCDVDIALWMIHEINSYDEVVLLSGDWHFETLLRHIKAQGKKVICVAAKARVELQNAVDTFIELEDIRLHIEK